MAYNTSLEYGTSCGQDLDIQGMIQGMIQALVQDLQAEAYDLQAVQELFTSFSKVRDWLEHQGNKQMA